jgi:hypothetical protein
MLLIIFFLFVVNPVASTPNTNDVNNSTINGTGSNTANGYLQLNAQNRDENRRRGRRYKKEKILTNKKVNQASDTEMYHPLSYQNINIANNANNNINIDTRYQNYPMDNYPMSSGPSQYYQQDEYPMNNSRSSYSYPYSNDIPPSNYHSNNYDSNNFHDGLSGGRRYDGTTNFHDDLSNGRSNGGYADFYDGMPNGRSNGGYTDFYDGLSGGRNNDGYSNYNDGLSGGRSNGGYSNFNDGMPDGQSNGVNDYHDGFSEVRYNDNKNNNYLNDGFVNDPTSGKFDDGFPEPDPSNSKSFNDGFCEDYDINSNNLNSFNGNINSSSNTNSNIANVKASVQGNKIDDGFNEDFDVEESHMASPSVLSSNGGSQNIQTVKKQEPVVEKKYGLYLNNNVTGTIAKIIDNANGNVKVNNNGNQLSFQNFNIQAVYIDIVSYDGSWYLVRGNGKIIEKYTNGDGSIKTEIATNISINSIVVFNGYLYVTSTDRFDVEPPATRNNNNGNDTLKRYNSLFKLAHSHRTNKWFFEKIILNDNNGQPIENIIDIGTNTRQNLLWIQNINGNGYLITEDKKKYQCIHQEKTYSKRTYGNNRNQYLDISNTGVCTYHQEDGSQKIVDNVINALILHDGQCLLIPADYYQKVLRCRLINWEPYCIVYQQ